MRRLRRKRATLIGLVAIALLLMGFARPAQASLHTYQERPGQVTLRSRQSLRDFDDRAWQAIAFKRLQSDVLQGMYLRLVGFPGTVEVDRQRPIVLLAATGEQWQLPWAVDPQTKALPESVGQYDLQPLVNSLTTALPLELQIPLRDAPPAEMQLAPFIVREWLQVKTSDLSPPVDAAP